MKVLALLPVKLHSTRVPGKNTLNLGGKRCFEWSIEHLSEITADKSIVIVTDDPIVAEYGHNRGLEYQVIPLDERAATFELADHRFLRYVLERLPGQQFDTIAISQACTPIKPKAILQKCLDYLVATGADLVQTCYTIPARSHPWLSVVLDAETGRPHLVYPGASFALTNSFPKWHRLTGAGIVFKTSVVFAPGNHYLLLKDIDIRMLIHEESELVDIDDPSDVEWARFRLQAGSAVRGSVD